MSDIIKPCPFCGNYAEAGHTGVWWVRCADPDCGADGPTRPTEAECISAWNAAPRATEARWHRNENHGFVEMVDPEDVTTPLLCDLAATVVRLHDILACERGERAPEGWGWSALMDQWVRDTRVTLRVQRFTIGWRYCAAGVWSDERYTYALEATEAADRATKETK